MSERVQHHLAFKCPLESLDAVIIDDSRNMQLIIRAILQPMRIRRMRFYDTPEAAMDSMMAEPPNLVIANWFMGKQTGAQFMHAMRHKDTYPLCQVPVIIMTAQPTRQMIASANKAGAQTIVAKPLSQRTLQQRISWILNDARALKIVDDHYAIEGGELTELPIVPTHSVA